MTKTTFISAIALASVLGFVGPSVAQDHMIDCKAAYGSGSGGSREM